MNPSQILRPCEGGTVIDPATGRVLAAEGQRVEITKFWARLIASGDVVVVPDQPTRKTKSAPRAVER